LLVCQLVAAVAVGQFVSVELACAQGDYLFERVATGLNQPVSVAQAPGDNLTLYVTERADPGNQLGRIIAYNPQTGTSSTFLDVPGSIVSDGGLLNTTFHPDFQSNGLFYTVTNNGGVNALDEWQAPAVGTPVMLRRLLEYNNLSNVFHTMNQPLFRPGGNGNDLFLLLGDGGTQANQPSFDPALIESVDSPYGKLLRFDLSADFTTPPSDTTHPGIDVVALGLRNPYRGTFDRQTGDLYIADVGFNAVEEVNFIAGSHFANPAAPPLDFGWTDREGTIATIANNAGGPGSPGDINPIFQYAHNAGVDLGYPTPLTGQSITGGILYRGPAAELQGRYFFADFITHEIYSGLFDNSTPIENFNGQNLSDLRRHDIEFETLAGPTAELEYITSFAEDNQGNLYVVRFGDSFFPALGTGEVYRLIAAPLAATIDRETGAITLTNVSASAIQLDSLTISSAVGAIDTDQLQPITGNYDVAGSGEIDDTNAWAIIAATPQLFVEQATSGFGTLGAGQSLVLSDSGGWFRSPREDLEIRIELDGQPLAAGVSYVGNNDAAWLLGDINFDGQIDRHDFVLLASSAHSSLATAAGAASYALGDLDFDGDNDYFDFRLFQQQFVAHHGAAAWAALQAVPEPATQWLVATAVAVGAMVVRRRRW
jgi:hypothetical protein